MEEIRTCDILEMSLGKVRSMAKEHSVPLGKCQSLDDFRERLMLHKNKMMERNFDIQHEFSALKRRESSRCMTVSMQQQLSAAQEALRGLQSEVMESLEQVLQSPVRNHGNRTPLPVLNEIEARISKLTESECSVVVAGETNAGKSTLLNLLLGMEVLPTSILSCTAVVCTLRYASDYSADVFYADGHVEHLNFTDLDDARRGLEDIAAETDHTKREQKPKLSKLDVYMPAAILQSGVTLVDTPGIGENDIMDRCTMEYVQSHSASAYIYVIKTDHAGGVQDDQLLEFLRSILSYNKMADGLDVFDPSSAIFVCNRWDQIPKEQKPRVQQNAYQKLKDVWPNFDPKQAFFISARSARMHWDVDHAYITEEYEKLLKGLKDVFVKAQHNSVNHHYRWLKHLLHICTNMLETTIAQCSVSDDVLVDKFTTTAQKLEALHTKASETTGLLRRQVEEEALKLCDKFGEILKERETLSKLEKWDPSSIPPMPNFGTGQTEKWVEEIDTIIMRRLVDLVDERMNELKVVENMEMEFKLKAQQHLLLLDEEMDSIVSDMSDRTSLNSSMCSTMTGASSSSDDDLGEELMQLYHRRGGGRFRQLHNFSKMSKASGGARDFRGSMMVLPKVTMKNLLRNVLKPFTGVMEKIRERRRSSVFSTDPAMYLKSRSSKLTKMVQESKECHQQMVLKYRGRLDTFVSDIDNSVPRFVTLYKQIMDDIRVNHRKFQSQKRELLEVMEKLEPIRDQLRGFGALYIRDLTAENIVFSLDVKSRRASIMVSLTEHPMGDSGYDSLPHLPSPFKASGTSQGLWCAFRTGCIQIGDVDEQVMGRSYFHSPPDAELIREIARLRCLKSTDVAPFFGMTRTYNPPAFLFTGDLISARSFLSNGFYQPQDSVPLILEGTLRGLDYLHKEGLVHMELTLETLMVNRDGKPRLCGACLPRCPRFPPDAEVVSAKPFFCLSPEVLRNEMYSPEDDIYSFGLIVLETCLRVEPYADQRSLKLEEFKNSIHPSSMLALDKLDLRENMSAILRGCLLPARGLRIRMRELRLHVSKIKDDPEVQLLSCCERRIKHKPITRGRRVSCDESQRQTLTASLIRKYSND